MAERNRGSIQKTSARPTISLPPKPSVENFFTGGSGGGGGGGGVGASPGPMTLVSNFFTDNDPGSDYRSFSQLLAGAMGSPVPGWGRSPSFFTENLMMTEEEQQQQQQQQQPSKMMMMRGLTEDGVKNNNNNRPLSLMITQSPMFTVPPGLSPTSFLESPGFYMPGGQVQFGISHQQALAQVTAQATQSQSLMHRQAEYLSCLSAPSATALVESPEFSHSDQRSQPPLVVDKPADDGYNWRKYGQKQVKNSEYPRSYYKCTQPNCPVTKKVERSLAGHVTEIIYKGKHNHEPPTTTRRSKAGNSNGSINMRGNPEIHSGSHTGNLSNEILAAPISKNYSESFQAKTEQFCSDSEKVGASEMRVDEGDDDEPDAKRRNLDTRLSEPSSSQRTGSEANKIIVQTTSEVDILDDGYKWRKYGQKVVKGNPYPRSYYKCTSAGCSVRKHVERASTDPKAVITTYEGKHNHDVPAAKNSSHNTINSNISQLKAEQIT